MSLGESAGGRVRVTSGLAPGDVVVTTRTGSTTATRRRNRPFDPPCDGQGDGYPMARHKRRSGAPETAPSRGDLGASSAILSQPDGWMGSRRSATKAEDSTMNFLASICIRRPVFATVLTLVFLVFGVVGYLDLGLDRFPKIDFPIITVTTRLPGSASEEVETEITDKIEEAVNTTSGIDELRSRLVGGHLAGLHHVRAGEGRRRGGPGGPRQGEPRAARPAQGHRAAVRREVRSRLDAGDDHRRLGAGVDPRPDRVLRQGAAAAVGIAAGRGAGDDRRRAEAADQRAVGPAEAPLAPADGGRRGPGPAVAEPAGARRHGEGRPARVHAADAWAAWAGSPSSTAIAVANRGGHTITIGDLGHVEDGAEEIKSLARYNDTPAVLLEHPQAVGHEHGRGGPAAQGAAGRLAEARPQGLPASPSSATSRRSSRRRSTRSRSTWSLGGLLAAVVIFFFLANLRTTVISALAIPTSIISAFAVVYYMGFTLNSITLLALALSVGIVIDDAIVVLENIYRFIEEKDCTPLRGGLRRHQGDRPGGALDHALAGRRVPAHRLHGRHRGPVPQVVRHHHVGDDPGEHDHQLLAHAHAGRPLAESRSGRARRRQGRRRQRRSGRRPPRRLLRLASKAATWRCCGSRCGTAGSSCWRRGGMLASVPPLMRHVRKNFLPDDDQSEFEVKVRAPEGTSLEATFVILDRIARDIRGLSGVEYTLTSVADSDQRIANEGTVYVRMVPLRQRRFDQFEMMNYVRNEDPAAVPQAGPADQRQPGGRLLRRRHVAGRRAVHDRRPRHAEAGPVLAEGDAPTCAACRGPSTSTPRWWSASRSTACRSDRAKAADLGVSIADVANTLRLLVAGDKASDYNEKGEQYEVHVRATAEFRNRLDELATVSVPSSKYGIVALGDVVKFDEGTGPAEINRLNRNRQVTISCNMTPGTSQQTILDAIEASVKRLDMGPDYTTGLLGKSKEMARTFRSFLIVFISAIIFAYLVIAAQFESWLHPITILLSLPLTLPFALISLILFGQSLNIFSLLGILVLFAVVKKNSILQIDHTNQLRAVGPAARRGHPGRQSRPAAAHPHDHRGLRGRHDPAAGLQQRRRLDQQGDQRRGGRRPDALAPADAGRHARGLFALRRPLARLLAAHGPRRAAGGRAARRRGSGRSGVKAGAGCPVGPGCRPGP